MKKVIGLLLNADSIYGKILCTLLYLLMYDYVYKTFVYEVFGYMADLEYQPMSLTKCAMWIAVSIIPIVWYRGVMNVSSYIGVFMYLFIYIPFLHSIFIIWNISLYEQTVYSLTLCLFFTLYLGMNFNWNIFKDIILKPQIPFKYIEYVTIVLSILFIVARGSQMHMVNIFTETAELYANRQDNSEQASGILKLIVYFQGWLSGAFYPFLLVCYLDGRQWIKSIMVLLGYVALFMVDMQKITFFMPFILVGLYFLFRFKETTLKLRLHSIMMLTTALISFVVSFFQDDKILFAISAIILLRTVCVTGWLTQMYIYFFHENPYTHYGHINIVNAIANNYPYDDVLGKTVAYHTQNANANLFLTDGLAAWGLTGIIIIGIIFWIFLLFINAICRRYKAAYVCVMFVPALTCLLNASFFSTLLSNGMFILMVLISSTDNTLLTNRNYEKK